MCKEMSYLQHLLYQFSQHPFVFSFPFQSLFKMQSAAARGCTKALQASNVFQVSLEKTLKHLGWPQSLPCFRQGIIWPPEMPSNLTVPAHPHWKEYSILYDILLLLLLNKKSLKNKCSFLLSGSDSYLLKQVYHMKKLWLWGRQWFNYTSKEIIIQLQHKWK